MQLFRKMIFGALFRKLGWTGMMAGLFAFLAMGALGPCVLPSQSHVAGSHESLDQVVAHLDHAHGDHAHGSANHGDQSSPADPCKDGCCGAGCHVLTGPAVLASAPLAFAIVQLLLAPDWVADDSLPLTIERPPRA